MRKRLAINLLVGTIAALLIALWPVALSSAQAQAAVRGPKSAGALAVKKGKLVDKRGEAIQLRGVSTHGLAWYPAYVNDACFRQLRTKWDANVVRLAMYTEEYGGYCSGGSKKDLIALVKKGVRLATKNDLYVIVDWHILSDGNPNTHVSQAKSFFAKVSAEFKDNDNVLYEICNEPNGGTTWSDIRAYAKKVIPTIRKNDPDAVVLVGTPTWSQEIDEAAAKPLSFKNVMYTLHFYAATHKDDLRSRMTTAAKGGLPVFVSEFGICDASGNGSIDKSSANTWLKSMNKLGISWCMWSLCNKAESASIIKSSCNKTSGFASKDLATSGTWLVETLGGSAAGGSGSASTQTGDSGTGSASGKGQQAPPTTEPNHSKTTTFSVGKLRCKLSITNSWPASDGKTCYQYDLSITNKGADRASWKVAIPFNKKISFVNGWNGSFATKGKKLAIRNASYNGQLDKGETTANIGFQITAAKGLKPTP